MNVAFCSSEVFPFAKTGGLGDVCGSLPLALEKMGINVSVFLPGYRCVGRAGHSIEQLSEHVSRATLGSNINVYFIEDEKYFDREGFYGDHLGDFKDNLERFSYFCDQILILLKQLDFQPDIVHCHDWQTALIPVYLKEMFGDDAFYAKTKSILTIHNLAFQGVFPKEKFNKLGLDETLFSSQGFEFYDQINLLKAGILYSDKVTTVSSQYAKEIKTKRFGCGLDRVLRERKDGIAGILNGLDDDIWNPEKDGLIEQKYSVGDFEEAKLTNKVQLQKELRLDIQENVPLFGFVGRLSHQKGIDLILETMEDFIKMGAQMAFLGVGDAQYQEKLNQMASRYPQNIAVRLEFNESLGHQIYAGSDLFLMPSQFEPCGLSQMISLCYGTIPVVYKTGGLADTIKSYGLFKGNGNGFVFLNYSKAAFLNMIKKADKVFHQKDKFRRLRKNAMCSEFSWKQSARQYQELYTCV